MPPSPPHTPRDQIPWKFRAKGRFEHPVQVRGDAYFRQHRVRLERATPREINALVLGTEPWRCSVLDLNGRLHLECDCPHFRSGHACKHLWAAILAADKALQSGPAGETVPPPAAAAPEPRTNKGPAKHSGKSSGTSTITSPKQAGPSWRELLLPPGTADSATIPGRWDGAPGHVLLRYELRLHPNPALQLVLVQLTVIRQAILKSGEPGRQRTAASITLVEEPDLPEIHRAILELALLERLTERPGAPARYGASRAFEDWPLSASRLPRLLPLLAATGRCRVQRMERGQPTAIIADPLRPGQPLHAALAYDVAPDSAAPHRKELVYTPRLDLDGLALPLAEVPAFFPCSPVHCVVQGALHVVPGLSADRLQALCRAGWRVHVPKQELRALYQTPEGARLPLPEALAPAALPATPPAPCLELELAHGRPVTARLWLAYGDLEIACDDPRPGILDVEAWTRQDRQPREEHRLLRRLLDVLGQENLPDQEDLSAQVARAAAIPLAETSLWALLQQLEPLRAEGWTLRTRDRRPLCSGELGALRLEAGGAGLDWFELQGGVHFGEGLGAAIVPLPRVVRAFLRGERTVDLEDGRLGVLPEGWLARHAAVLGLDLELQEPAPRGRKGGIRLHGAQLLALEEALHAGPEGEGGAGAVAMDRASAQWRRTVRAFDGISLPAPPASLLGQLRPYQHETLGWLDFLGALGFGGILADDMGLGKTLQALAWLALEQERRPGGGPSLVVVPTSLLGAWQDEAARFCPSLRVLPYAGAGRTALVAAFAQQDVVLVTYGLLRRDVEILRRVRWRCLILDESQAVKNPDSQTAKAARALQAERRLCMTGTPLENRLEELWSQMQLCAPGLLGSRKHFEMRFVRPLSAQSVPDTDTADQANTQASGQPGDQARALLQRLIKPFILRRTKAAVAPDLPPKQEAVLRCEMPAAQAKLYARLREHYRGEILAAVEAQGLEHSRFTVLEGLLRLRQAACHTALVGEARGASGKLETLSRVVREVVAEGHKALIFSQFTGFLSLIRTQLDADGVAYATLDGSTPAQARAARVAAFQDPAGPPVFCISLKAGGVGLTLTAADYVFLMDPWWNPAVEAQAMDRAHRIGQTRTVFVYRLVSQGTIDEKILTLQEHKRDLAALLDAGATTAVTGLAGLTREDLDVLLE